jgi:hypothetical protein
MHNRLKDSEDLLDNTLFKVYNHVIRDKNLKWKPNEGMVANSTRIYKGANPKKHGANPC